ncbi:MAG: condensation domain-containing protein [bacterium]
MNQIAPLQGVESRFPATPAQDRLWCLARDHGDLVSKNIAVQWELQGRFSDGNVEAAFQTVFDRHEILRTAFEEQDGKLWQRVVGQVPFHLGSIDIRSIAPAKCEERIAAIAHELAAKPFDMAMARQLRACLVRFAPERAMLLIATHYGVFDGFSIKVLGREIGMLIGAAETGTAADLPELALQYGDYAQWRAACADSAALMEARAFWHAKLRGKAYFEVAPDRLRRPGAEREGNTLKLPMAPNFRADLERAAKAQATSPFALGAGVMAAALHAVTGRPEVGFTTCVAGREEAELENLIGVFVNPVVLQFDCEGATVGDLVSASRRIVAEALANGDYPFDHLARDLGQSLDPAKTPFVAPFFSLQSVFVEEQDYGPLRIVSVPSHTPQVTHDLAVQVIGRASGWHMIIDYDTGLFDEATVRQFADVVQQGFAAAFERPTTAASALVSPPAAVDPVSLPVKTAPMPVARAAPQTLKRLSAIWRSCLGAVPQGPGSDFFDLGGNSLGALRMLAKVEADFGARITIAGFFDDPTLGGLASKIDVILGTAAPVADDETNRFWNLIALRSAPATAPLIVSVNQPFLYHGLVRSLEPEVEVVNLHVRDTAVLEGPDAEVLADLVDSAANIVAGRAMGRRVFLIGHCVDGTLSLLIARRLVALGHAPDLVSMIDCWAPDANADLSPGRVRMRRLGEKARRRGQNLRQLVAGEIGWTEFLSRNKITRPILQQMGRVARATEAEREEWAVNARLVALVRTMSHAHYAGQVVLFSTRGQHGDARSRLFGWTGRLPADTPIYDLPGWHEYALKKHGVKAISAILGCRLMRSAG